MPIKNKMAILKLLLMVSVLVSATADAEEIPMTDYTCWPRAGSPVDLDPAMWGYEPRFANSQNTGQVDPAIRNKIFEPKETCRSGEVTVNTFINVLQHRECDSDFSTTTIRHFDQYMKERSTNDANSGEKINEIETNILLSEEEKKLSRLFQRGGEMVRAVSECGTYTVILSLFTKPVFTDAFLDGLRMLHVASKDVSSDYSKSVLFQFIAIFGTHFSQTTHFGSRIVYEKRFTSGENSAEEEEERNLCLEDASRDSQEIKSRFSMTSKSCSRSVQDADFFQSIDLPSVKVQVYGAPRATTGSSPPYNSTKSSAALYRELNKITDMLKYPWLATIPLDDKWESVPNNYWHVGTEVLNGTAIKLLFDTYLFDDDDNAWSSDEESDASGNADNIHHRVNEDAVKYGAIILAGGHDGSKRLDSVESYGSPEIPSLPETISRFTLINVNNDLLFACGGRRDIGYLASNLCYKINLSWSSPLWYNTVSLPEDMAFHTAVSLQDHIWFVYESKIFNLDTQTGNFQTLVLPFVVTNQHCAVSNHTHSFIVGVGRMRDEIWVNTEPGNPSMWQRVAILPRGRTALSCLWFRSQVVVTGGGNINMNTDVFILDVHDNSVREAGSLVQGRSLHQMMVWDNKPAVVGGGFRDSNGNPHWLNTIETYDVDTNQWQTDILKLQTGRNVFGLVQLTE